MRLPVPPRWRSRAVVALLVCLATSTFAAEPPPAPASALSGDELVSARLSYAVVRRSGSQSDLGPGLAYNGFTPNDLSLELSGYFGHFGGVLFVDREAFTLLDGTSRVTGGALYRGYVGPSARVRFGPVRLEVLAAYHLAQLPLFGSTASPAFAPAMRHAIAAGARVSVSLPFSTRLELRGLYPFVLASTSRAGESLQSEGFSAAASLHVPVGHAGSVRYGIVGQYELVSDSITGASLSGAQRLNRFGLALELALHTLPPPPPPPRLGGLRLTVVDDASGEVLKGAKVTVRDQVLITGADGAIAIADVLEPGKTIAEVALEGYLPARGEVTVAAGSIAALTVRAQKEPPKVGALEVVLVDKEDATPLANAEITVHGQKYVAGPTGRVTIAELPPGATALAITAAGYRPAQEVAMVAAGHSGQVAVALAKVEQKVLATLTGLVRGAGGGRPIAASLEIPEQRLKTNADAKGAFTVRVPGGRYRVIISAPGYLRQVKTVTVRDGDQAIFNVDLHPERR